MLQCSAGWGQKKVAAIRVTAELDRWVLLCSAVQCRLGTEEGCSRQSVAEEGRWVLQCSAVQAGDRKSVSTEEFSVWGVCA